MQYFCHNIIVSIEFIHLIRKLKYKLQKVKYIMVQLLCSLSNKR